ncbi:MAG: shikimate kinase [Bacteroidales bacterium]|nr:shikimate kinase [Bacteroidales bacterium]
MLVFLIGFMGAGKTTLGKALAKKLGYQFIDLDDEIERHSGSAIPELFAREQESGFRKIEQHVLHKTITQIKDPKSEIPNCIIACGGGAPCYQQNLPFMKSNGFVIYLEVSPEILCERLHHTPTRLRPLLPAQTPEQLLSHIRNLLAQRRHIYEAAHWKC